MSDPSFTVTFKMAGEKEKGKKNQQQKHFNKNI